MNKPALDRVVSHYIACLGSFIERLIVSDCSSDCSSSRLAEARMRATTNVRYVSVTMVGFSKSKCINVGLACCRSPYVLVCDADVMVDYQSLRLMNEAAVQGKVAVLQTVRESVGGAARPGPGIVCAARQAFLGVGGYDSGFVGWGLEDRDLLWRLQAVGGSVVELGVGLHLSHSEAERVQHYDLDRATSRRANFEYMEKKQLFGHTTGTYAADSSSTPFTVILDQ